MWWSFNVMLNWPWHEPEDDNDNVQYFRGWENKKAWKIKPNLVLGWKTLEKNSYSSHKSLDNSVQNKLESVEKMLDLLTGDFTPGPSISACATAIQNGWTSRNIQLKHSCVSFFTKKVAVSNAGTLVRCAIQPKETVQKGVGKNSRRHYQADIWTTQNTKQ